MQRRPTAILAVLLLAAALAMPAAALAQSPFLPLPQGAQPTVQQPAVTTSTSGGGGLKTWQEVLIFAAGIVLIAGIAMAILGDARRRAPVATRATEDDPVRRAELAQQRRRAKQHARRRARHARAQRKRNR